MPSTAEQTQQLLLRREPLTDEEWFNLLDLRAQQFKPIFSQFSFPELGDFKCLKDGIWHSAPRQMVREHWPVELDHERFSIRGIFDYDPKHDVQAPYHWLRYVWGLTTEAKWIILTISYEPEQFGGSGKSENIKEYARGFSFECDVPVQKVAERASLEPKDIWAGLERASYDVLTRAIGKHQWAEDFHRQLQNQTQMIGLLPRGSNGLQL